MVRILPGRPACWRTEALHELRAKLRVRSEGFTDEGFRQADQYQFLDIISMVN